MHEANWADVDPAQFLARLYIDGQNEGSVDIDDEENEDPQTHAPMLRPLCGDDGKIHGRAALNLTPGRYYPPYRGTVTVGGFAYEEGEVSGLPQRFYGVLTGEAVNAARTKALSTLPPDVVARWATEQARLCPRTKFSLFSLLYASRTILSLGGHPDKLPITYLGGKFVDITELEKFLRNSSQVIVPLSPKYDERIMTFKADALSADHLLRAVQPNIAIASTEETMAIHADAAKAMLGRSLTKDQIVSEGLSLSVALGPLESIIPTIWGTAPTYALERGKIFTDTAINNSRLWFLVLNNAAK